MLNAAYTKLVQIISALQAADEEFWRAMRAISASPAYAQRGFSSASLAGRSALTLSYHGGGVRDPRPEQGVQLTVSSPHREEG